ncbi:HAMP domain-containing histidine kinase [bacterium]|nr:HAMP domain-containing histidine kinase [bacterium]
MNKRTGLNKYWIMIAGFCVICISLLAITRIWSNLVRFEEVRQAEHENFSMHISKTAENFIANKEYGYFSDIIQLLSKIDFIRFLSVHVEGKEVRKAGDRQGLDDAWLDKSGIGSQASYFDEEKRDLYVNQKLNYQDKPTNIKMVFSLSEYEKPKQSIVQAFILIIVLLFILAGLGFFLFRIHHKLEIAEKTKEDMIYSITHDAKQDLTVIQGKMNSLLKKTKGKTAIPDIENDLKNTKESADSIDRFLNNLNDQQHLQSGAVETFFEKTNLIKLLISVLEGVEEQVSSLGIKILFNQQKESHLVSVDQQITCRIIKNIVHNAIKFSPVNSTITVDVKKEAESVKIFVEDQGPGIARENWRKIFLPYIQLHPKKAGMGLGLANAKKLVGIMGGEMGITKSLVGKGTTFYIVLPLLKTK